MNQIIHKIRSIINKEQKKTFFFIVLLMIVAAFLEFLSIGFIIPVVSIVVDQNIQNSYINFEFLNSFIKNQSSNQLLLITFFLFFLIFTIKFFFSVFFLYKKNDFIFQIRNSISIKIFKSFLKRPYDFHQQNNSSKLAINCKYEVEQFTANILISGLEILSDIGLIISLLILLISLEFKLTIILISTFFLFMYLYQFILKKRSMIWANERQKYDILISKVIQEGLGSIKEIILNFKENYFLKNFSHYLQRSLVANVRAQMSFEIPRPLMELVAIIAFILIFYFLTFLDYETSRIITLLGIFAAVTFKLLPCFNRLIGCLQRIRYGLPVVDFIYNELMNSNNLIEDDKNIIQDKDIQKFKLKKFIAIKSLNFSYKDSEQNKKIIFDNANFKIAKGELIAIVGESGVGKSTLLNLISGLVKNYEGDILIDNHNIKELRSIWTNRVAFISQNPFFLDDSIKHNIAFAENSDDLSLDKIWSSLKSAQLYDYVNNSKDKLETVIGEDGTKMSGGQLQRLAIARALYQDSDLIILDESLNALDPSNENEILQILAKLKNEKTIILISHKESSLKYCDQVFKIENKKILLK
jgi:ABC-type multidrug transport system fused ATPase/permease subunit